MPGQSGSEESCIEGGSFIFVFFLGLSVIFTTNLAHKSGRGILENQFTKIKVKKVRVLGLTFQMR